MKFLYWYEALVILRTVICISIHTVGNLAPLVEMDYSKLWLVDCVACLCLCNIFEMINESQKGLNWSFIPSCHLPSTEKPILLGSSPLFTLAGLHLLLLPVTAIKISSRSAIMVSSCHCIDKKGKVQHYWNVLDSEREGRGDDNTRTIITVWQSLIAIVWYQTNIHCSDLYRLLNRPFLSAEIYVLARERNHLTLVSMYQRTFLMTSA